VSVKTGERLKDQVFPSHLSFRVFDNDSTIDVPDPDQLEIVFKSCLTLLHWLLFTYDICLVLALKLYCHVFMVA
jgi:hypothetical protein